jgi:hypothetical protein
VRGGGDMRDGRGRRGTEREVERSAHQWIHIMGSCEVMGRVSSLQLSPSQSEVAPHTASLRRLRYYCGKYSGRNVPPLHKARYLGYIGTYCRYIVTCPRCFGAIALGAGRFQDGDLSCAST